MLKSIVVDALKNACTTHVQRKRPIPCEPIIFPVAPPQLSLTPTNFLGHKVRFEMISDKNDGLCEVHPLSVPCEIFLSIFVIFDVLLMPSSSE